MRLCSTSQAEQALGRSLRSLARAAGQAYSPVAVRAYRLRHPDMLHFTNHVAPKPLSTKPLLKGDSPSAEAAEKVPLCILISCNYILLVAGFFVPLSY